MMSIVAFFPSQSDLVDFCCNTIELEFMILLSGNNMVIYIPLFSKVVRHLETL